MTQFTVMDYEHRELVHTMLILSACFSYEKPRHYSQAEFMKYNDEMEKYSLLKKLVCPILSFSDVNMLVVEREPISL